MHEALTAAGIDAGLNRVGVTTTAPFPSVREEMERRKAEGLSGRLTFTYKDPARATDVTSSFPWAESLVVGLRAYLPEAGHAPSRPLHGRVARFAVDDPYPPLRRGLEAVAARLIDEGNRAEILVDDERLVDRAAAIRSGLAWWGKSTLALTPGLGPWFVIGSVVTDAVLDPGEPMRRDCGTCDACLPACPTGALVAPGILDARRCLAALAQAPGVIPRRWRAAMGDRIYGCDECLAACPPGRRLADSSRNERGSVDLRRVLDTTDEALLDRFGHFYLPRRSPRFLRRNVLVAMGNDGSPELWDPVARHVDHSDWLLRAHAVWALARLAGDEARPVLEHRLDREKQPEVLEELEAELAAISRGRADPVLPTSDFRLPTQRDRGA